MANIASWLALTIVLSLGLSILLYQGVTGVPPMSSSAAETADVVRLLSQAGFKDQDVVYDLGCGWGTLVVALAKAFPDARIRGIELSPLPYWVARLRTGRLPNVTLHRANFYDCDLSDAAAVTCYLMIGKMPKLAAFLDRMLAPGTPVVALTFWFRDRQAVAVREGPGLRGAAALYLWPARRPD